MRILLVEDNRDILANLADYLGLKGYTVDCAQDGLSGLHLAATEHYDLIVLDIMKMMPWSSSGASSDLVNLSSTGIRHSTITANTSTTGRVSRVPCSML